MLNKTAALLIILFFIIPSGIKAGISVGINAGLTHDQNNLEPEISSVNSRMQKYVKDNPGTDITPINIPYTPVFGANIRMIAGAFLLRTGVHYAEPLMYPSTGHVSPGGNENEIKFRSYSLSIPITLCLTLSAGFNTSVYFGAGAGLHYSYLKITQSDPGGGFYEPDVDVLSYKTRHYGWNCITGIEIPISDRITVTAEWLYQNAVSGSVENRRGGGGNPRSLDSSYSIILFGVNYYLRPNL